MSRPQRSKALLTPTPSITDASPPAAKRQRLSPVADQQLSHYTHPLPSDLSHNIKELIKKLQQRAKITSDGIEEILQDYQALQDAVKQDAPAHAGGIKFWFSEVEWSVIRHAQEQRRRYEKPLAMMLEVCLVDRIVIPPSYSSTYSNAKVLILITGSGAGLLRRRTKE